MPRRKGNQAHSKKTKQKQGTDEEADPAKLNLVGRANTIIAMLSSKDENKRIDAVADARALMQDFPEDPIACNSTAYFLMLAVEAMPDQNSNEGIELLNECLQIRFKVVQLTPNCLYSWIFLFDLLETMNQDERAFPELPKAMILKQVDDPLTNHLFVSGDISKSAFAERCKLLFDSLANHRARLWPLHMDFISKATDSLDRMERADVLAAAYSGEFKSRYIRAHSALLLVHDKFSNEHAAKSLIQKALADANKAANACPTSVLICLFQAKVMFLLDDYEEAEIECQRGLAIKCPSDPNDDRIALEQAIQPEGNTHQERVSYVRDKLNKLLNSISSRLKEYWSTMSHCNKGKLLTSNIDDVTKYCREKNQSNVSLLALMSVQKYGQMKNWFCPFANCTKGAFATRDLLIRHLHMKHDLKLPPNVSCESASWCPPMVYLWKNQAGCGFLCLDTMHEIYDIHTPCLSSEKSFGELMNEKAKERSIVLKEFQEKIPGMEGDTEISKLWCQLLDASEIDFSEFLFQVVGLYQRSQLIKQMVEDPNFIIPKIDKAYIHSVLWADDSNEIKDNQKINCQKDKTFLELWSEKKRRGYKWFLNADRLISVEHANNLFSDAGDSALDAGLPVSSDANSLKSVRLDPYPEFLEVQTNWKRLIILEDNVPGTGKFGSPIHYAWITGVRSASPMIRCVASSKRPMEELNLMFSILIRCEHQNILKPLGVWPCNNDPSMGYIIFPYVDGAISELSVNDLFIKENNAIFELTKVGYKISRDMLSAVKYVNTHYKRGEANTNCMQLPVFPLNLSADCVFYVKDVDGQYNIRLAFFDTESTQGTDFVDLAEQVGRGNFNAMGAFLEALLKGQSVVEEIDHLVKALKGTSVSYDDLLWEPGFWTAGEKMLFIKEVFWVQDSDQIKQSELQNKPSLGIQPFAVKIDPNFVDTNLQRDFKFLRDNILAHEEGSYGSYTGQKEEIGMRKSIIEKSLRKEAPKYMLKFVEEIRALKWPIISPLLPSSEHRKWMKSSFPPAQPPPSVIVIPASPMQPPNAS